MKHTGEKDLLIIMPAYNEEKNILPVLEQLEAQGIIRIADVLVINDASSDSTNWIVKKKDYALVTNVFNLGYGSAIQLGYKYAIRRKYKYVIQMDADGQHDICNIVKLYQELKTPDEDGVCPDIVLGSRFMKESSDFPVPFTKKVAYSLFRFLIKLFTGRRIADPTTGLQGLSGRAVLYYSKFGHFDDMYPDANMIIQMLILEYRIREIPAVMHCRSFGTSMHSGLKPFIYMFRMVLSIFAVVFRLRVLQKKAGVKKDEIYY
ncbi:MAG: glycosyltransferase family 2 protein [Roseburia sp.]|nr:glycosyltransferase family 2 protein [Roseburia sp.]